ncbi:hypothetical protein FACS189454_05780 [Planctomycetales bacterium]|nr:hypothetical protein FACS189454_05780 [Planctomycetales bacterium]
MENKVKIFPAFLSLLLPGLGQVAQKRFGTGAAFFALHLFTSFIPYHLIVCASLYWNWNWSCNSHPAIWIFASAFFACLILTAFFAVLDTVLWQLDHKTHFRKSYWTLVTIPFLFVILLPAVSVAREAARRMQCGNHIKQLVLAMHNYHDNYGHLPPAYTVDADGKPLHSWRVLLLPYLEHSALYEQIRLDEPWDSEYNKQFHSRVPSVLRCPSHWHLSILQPTGERKYFLLDNDDNRCGYSLVIGKETAFDGSKTATFADIQDSTSNTVLIVERMTPVNWMQPDNDIPFAKACHGIDKDISGIGSMHPNGCYFGLADGRASFFPSDISPDVLKSVLTKSGGETITCP